ncbi:MAG: LysE family translocator [Pyrinomonadaceae bacterium]|nr:LysE family translocator [Blastocatellia bacterium]MCW5958406.1 LysE family translocator [Pyrinomonadaceae bacterium]
MFETQNFIAFLAASILIILAPGPAQALVLARTIGSGRKSGIMTAIGLNVGTLFHAVAAGLGLSAVLATSALAFSVVKLAGAGYLVYLGVRAVLTRPTAITETEPLAERSDHSFLKAVVTGVLNPKVALFFLAFLPQFVDQAHGSAFLQFVLLGSIIAAIDMVYESLLAFIAGGISSRVMNNARVRVWRERITGLALVGLGIRLAFAKRT